MAIQEFIFPSSSELICALGRDLCGHARGGALPAIVVRTPMAGQALKRSLAALNWTECASGAPLPWIGSLAQATERLSQTAGLHCAALGFPRARSVREALLAQELLSAKGLGESLGHSHRAALSLAGQWVRLFEGWEWLSFDGQLRLPPPQLALDVQTLRLLHDQNRDASDIAPWTKALTEHAEFVALRERLGKTDGFFSASEVWFCGGDTPSPLEVATAACVFNCASESIRIYRVEPATLYPDAANDRLLIAANSVEESAWSAVQSILQWRREGITDIGVVALDRRVARRARALLERAQETLDDRSGWALDTTVAATAVVEMSDLIGGRATTQSFLQWIQSPFVVQAIASRWQWPESWQEHLDGRLREFGRVTEISLQDIARSVDSHSPQAEFWNGLLAIAGPQSSKSRRPIFDWAQELVRALRFTGLEQSLLDDPAGVMVMGALEKLHAESATASAHPEGVSGGLWRALLARLLSEERFAEAPSSAPVRICTLSSLLWQLPQALVVIGADVGRLPARPVAQFFEPGRFAEMGLQNPPELIEREAFAQFCALWGSDSPITFVAMSEKGDSAVEFSNWLELLTLRGSARVRRMKAANYINAYSLLDASALGQIPKTESAAVWPHGLPETVSVSSAGALIQCPYRFFVSDLLGVDVLGSLEDEADAADLGSLIHQVLALAPRATHDLASASEWRRWLGEQIADITDHAFVSQARSMGGLNLPSAVRVRLKAEALALAPRLADWLARRSRGINQLETEQTLVRELLKGTTLKGRIDRRESVTEGERLIDFKTTDPGRLRSRLKSAKEDVQLALYAWLTSEGPSPARQALYVSVRHDRVSEIDLGTETGQGVDSLAQSASQAVGLALADIGAGRPILPIAAEENPKFCERCEARGICRIDDEPLKGSGHEP